MATLEQTTAALQRSISVANDQNADQQKRAQAKALAKQLASALKSMKQEQPQNKGGAELAQGGDMLPGIKQAIQQNQGMARQQGVSIQPEKNNNPIDSLPIYSGDIASLEEIGAAPELGEFSKKGFQSSLGASLINDDYEQAQSLASIYPDATFSRDQDSNIIATMPSGGSFYLNRPGLSGQDVAKFATRALAYTPAGRGITGVALPTLAKAGLQSAATEAGLQGVESGVGGSFTPESVGIAAVAAPLGQVAGEKIIGPALNRGSEAVKNTLSAGQKGRENIKAAVSDFMEFGDVPTLGTASGQNLAQGLQNLSSRLLGGGPIRKAIGQTSGKMQKRLAEIAEDISPITGEIEAGRVIQKGVTGENGFIKRFSDKSSQLWGKVDDSLGDAPLVATTNTAKKLDELVGTSEFGKVLNNPIIAKLNAASKKTGGQAPYKELKELRSMVGARLSSKELVSDIPRAELKQIYGAISKDIEALAKSKGGDALKQWKRANNYTRSGHARIDDFVKRIVGKKDLDKVFNAVAKGGEGVQAINAVKRSLKPQEWEAVASNVVRRLGRATAGQQDDLGASFSVNKFLTDWNKLGRAKNVMFSGSPKLNAYRSNLDRIASAANKFKESAQEMSNPSGSGQFLANVGAVTAGGGALGTGNLGAFGLVLAGISSNRAIAGQLMANPKFVKWLAQGATVKDWPAHVGRLSAVAAASGSEKEVLGLLKELESMSQLESPETSSPQEKETTPQ